MANKIMELGKKRKVIKVISVISAYRNMLIFCFYG